MIRTETSEGLMTLYKAENGVNSCFLFYDCILSASVLHLRAGLLMRCLTFNFFPKFVV